MTEIAAFFDMGGYAAFVWPSLGLTLVIMLGLLLQTLRQLRVRQRRLADLEAQGAQRFRRQPGAQTSTTGRQS
ncbi:heme exporter protein CcmD [Pelagibius litoralis]|uniref:Heme exporter protein D n=1 Tax=Pelagibius litoralis TaxID=374515 RepID=A0A967F3B4_9PROT|nr:heme exporter protein CcmD [Pelagibius litoralis]NIA72227.1 heme exporter protein CcmD [Pelagibius litoralis]